MVVLILLTQFIFIIAMVALYSKSIVGRMLIVFNLWWAILFVFSALNPMGGYMISNDAYLLFWLFILFFNLGYLCTKSKKVLYNEGYKECNKEAYQNDIIKQYDCLISKNKLLLLVICFVTAVLIYYSLKFNIAMSGDNIVNARNVRFFVGGLFESTFELLFYNYIISAFRYFFAFVIVFSIIYRRIKNLMFMLCVVDMLLYSYIGGSRFPIVMILVVFFITWIIQSYYKKVNGINNRKRNVFKLLVVIFLGVLALMILTAFRRGSLNFSIKSITDNINALLLQIEEYNVGPLSGLSYLLDNQIMTNHWLFGRAVILNGVDEILSYAFRLVDIPYEYAKNILGGIANVQRNIGNTKFNALYTCVYWFFSDFGYLGVCIYSLLFAWVGKKSVTYFSKAPSVFSLMICVHVFYFIIMSNMIWQINNVDSLLYLLALFLCKNRILKREHLMYPTGKIKRMV